MPLIYATGISGVGKSAVCHELIKRGYEAHDVDDQESTNGSKLSREWVSELAKNAEEKPVFVCGVKPRSEEHAVEDLFSKVIYLTIDEYTLRERLSTRESNDYGKKTEELEDIIKWIKDADSYHQRVGTPTIDATKPLDRVVDEVIRLAGA